MLERRTLLHRQHRAVVSLFKRIIRPFTIHVIPPPRQKFRLVSCHKLLVKRLIHIRTGLKNDLPQSLFAIVVEHVIRTVQYRRMKISMQLPAGNVAERCYIRAFSFYSVLMHTHS